MPIRRIMVAYGLWMAALTVVFMAVRPVQGSVRALVGLSASAAIVYGVRRYRPARAWAWLALAAVPPLGAAGQLIYDLLPGRAGTLKPGIEIILAGLVVMSVLMTGGLIGMTRSADRDLTAAVDVAILLLGAGLLATILIAVPYAVTPDLPGIQAVARVLFVARDVILLAAVAYLATYVRWNGSVALLVSGVTGFLTYDAVLRLGRIRGAILEGTAIELGWLFFAAAWGAAALLPTMATLGAPGAAVHRSVPLRLGLLATASVLPFTLLLATSVRPELRGYEPLVATAATIMLILVLVQLVGVAIRLRSQSEGERALREAVADMASARDAAAVTEAFAAAVPKLLPSRTGSDLLVLAGDDTDRTSRVRPKAPAGELMTAAQLRSAVGGQSAGRQALAYQLRADGVAGTGRLQTLYVSGGRTSLARVRDRLDVLASQASLVLDRIRLSQEIVRRATDEYVRALAQTSGDIILIVDDDDRITLAGPSADSIFGTANLVGVWLPAFVTEAERPAVLDLLRRTRAGETHLSGRGRAMPSETAVEPTEGVNVADWSVHRDDGSPTLVEVACRRVKAADPSVRGLVVDLRDVTEQRRLEAELTDRAKCDWLTGLATRQLLRDRLRQAVDARVDHGSLAGVVFLDLDDFKLINSEFGYEIGDAVLKTVADRLTASLPPGGMAARVGGDQFAVLVDVSTPAAVDEVGAWAQASITTPIQVGDQVVTCTASAGIATTAEAHSPAELTRQAEVALLVAQAAGRGQSHHFDPTTHSTILDRLELRTALDHALDDQALTLEYQPIVELATGLTAGFEALLRWQHPTRGQLSPAAFIDVAEESGLIVPIGDWILATAVREALRWDHSAPGAVPYVGVNVSPRQFGSPGFFGRIRRQLIETGLPASRLHLEITESLLLRDDARTWNELQRLRELGVQIAIDDFGTGYSALSYLGHVPLDTVKLDRSFVSSMTASGQQRELVKGVVRLAKILGLAVVAEGIETVEECAIAARIGCRYGQGYLFARPMPADAALAWLAKERDATNELAVSGGGWQDAGG